MPAGDNFFKMNNQFANFISTLFHPLFMPLYAILVLMNMDFFAYPVLYKIVVSIIVCVFSCIIPALFLVVLYKLKYIDSLRIEKKEQRHTLYFITIISYLSCLYMLWRININDWILCMFAGAILSVILLSFINICWKISIHAAAAGSFIGGTFFTCYFLAINPIYFFLLVLLIGGLIGTARLQLKAHSLSQVFAGILLGIFCMFLSFLFYMSIQNYYPF